jgi:hypothetical protein
MRIGISVSLSTKLTSGGPPPPPAGFVRFIPSGTTGMVTSDGNTFNSKE